MGNIFKNISCIIQINVYSNKPTNIAKKLRGIFKACLNTFFNRNSMVRKPKVINFAYYQQAVKY